MRIAHISDLHFSKRDWGLLQFFSKRWLGNVNSLFGRSRLFCHERLELLPLLFKELGISHVIVSGDVTTTSTDEEFAIAASYIRSIEKHGIEVFVIPGNHDHYTRRAHRQRRFYRYFASQWKGSSFDLIQHGVTSTPLSPEWTLVGLDSALATSWLYSTGLFSLSLERNLEKLLEKIDHNVILVNHFPFFQHENIRKRLERGDALKKLLLRFPNVKIYCHGHTHRHCIADLRPSHLPIILDSGSTPHRDLGFWNLIDIEPNHLTTDVFAWKEGAWQGGKQQVL